ncbi:MAG: BtpA/SgcQ family protein [Phaeodactylibacter sp.]|nr:BtpA/SgcQ family protein [Phaeodactylibacter sp.]
MRDPLSFEHRPFVMAMIHVAALPGTPTYGGNFQAILDQALKEARIYREAGVDGLLIENMHDTPYLNRVVGPEIVAGMAIVGHEVRKQAALPTGIQILAGANQAALAVALAAQLDFIRAEGFVFGHVADEGWMDSDAGTLLRYRHQIGGQHIPIWTDIKKKHSSHALTADVDLVETAKAAAFFRSDGLIVTGTSTGAPADPVAVQTVREATRLPVIIGSGITADNCRQYRAHCDGFIVGSYFKEDGHWTAPVDAKRVRGLLRSLGRS